MSSEQTLNFYIIAINKKHVVIICTKNVQCISNIAWKDISRTWVNWKTMHKYNTKYGLINLSLKYFNGRKTFMGFKLTVKRNNLLHVLVIILF